MMDLATHQRTLLSLIRSTYQPCAEEDPYIQQVAQSKDLEEARENIFLWRIWVLERSCVLTFTLLRRRGLLAETVRAFITRNNISPFRGTQGPAFLQTLSDHNDRLIASVAQFELALMKVKQGDPCPYRIRWEVDPTTVLNSLVKEIPDLPASGLPAENSAPKGAYQILVSRDLPGLFQIVSLPEEEKADPSDRPENEA